MADNLITTNITAHADFSSLRTQLAATTAQLLKLQETTAGTNAKLANQIAVMNKSFASTLTSTGQFSQHFVSLTSDVEKFGRNLDRGQLKLNNYFQTWQGHTRKTSNLVRELAKQQVMMENAIIQPIGKNAQGLMQYNVMVAKGLDEVKNRTAIARQELAIMNKVMLDGSNQLINWGKNTQWAGRQLTVGLTVPLAAFGMAAQKAFREADQELVRLTKVYGGLSAVSATELAKVRKDVSATAREIAGSYGIAYKDTIALAADLAATGQQGNALLESTRQTSRLAVLGEVDRQEAMKATLAIQNAFKQNTDELTQSIDFLNAVENQTSTSLADLVEAIPKAGPVVKSLGGDVKDLALYLTAMKEGGVNAAEGANAIKSAMASLINPTKVAKEMFTGFGIDIDQIVTTNAGNLTATITALQDSLDKLDPLSKSRAIEQLFGKFQYARMSALFENLGKEGSQTLQVMDLMKASATDLANISSRELGMMTESASGKFKRALASVQADLAAVGNQFLTISTKVLEVVDGIIKFFQKLPAPLKTFLNVLGGITAVSGPLIMLAGVMGNFIGYVIKGIFHLRQLAKGGQGFKLLTPEIMAADAAAKGLATSFYSDTEATIVLTNAVNTLAASFDTLQVKANAAAVAVQPGVSTVAGGVIMAAGAAGGGRYVDKENPLVGKPYSRDMSHLIPSGVPQMGTIFGTVPGAKPVNIRVGRNPQAYMDGDMPKIPGLTSAGSTSTGIVAAEAAKWHAMTAAISMQSEAELKVLKAEVMATGTVTSSLSDAYQALLPEFSEITSLAAAEVKAIVAQVQSSKITVETARAKIIALNATVEAMLAETTALTASSMGRTANLTMVPLTSQPVTDPVTGKSNMKEMFHKGPTKTLVDKIARALGGVKTSGAGYNIATTKPRFAKGGYVPGTGNTDTYHTTAEEGAFVINKKSTQANKPFIDKLLGRPSYYAEKGGQVPVVLTPGEAVVPAEIAQKNMGLMYELNGGAGNTSGMGRVKGGITKAQLDDAAKKLLAKALKVDQRMFDSPNWQEEVRLRHVMHDAGIYNTYAGFDEQESIDMAKADYDEAWEKSIKKDGHLDMKKWMRERMNIAKRRDAQVRAMIRMEIDRKEGPKAGQSQYKAFQKYRGVSGERFRPTSSLIGEIRARANEFGGTSLFDNVSDRLFVNGIEGTVSEHSARRSLWRDTKGKIFTLAGNLGMGMLGEAEINQLTNELNRGTRGIVPDMITMTNVGVEQKREWNAKKGIGSNKQQALAFLRKAILGLVDKRSAFRPNATSFPVLARNSGGEIPGQFAQRLFPGGRVFLGMPRSIKQVEAQRAAKAAMEKASLAVKDSRFSKTPVTEYDGLLEPTSGRSFPVSGIGGVYGKNGEKVFVKPVLDEKAALAELRATEIARDVHGLQTPHQRVVVMRDPTDPNGVRKLLALESKYDSTIANQDGNFTADQYFRQLVASALRGDKDLGRGNLSGNVLADVGPAGVFSAASGERNYSATMPSFKHQAMVNLMGVKGSGAKKFFAEATSDIPNGMTADEYNTRMLEEIESALPKLKQTIGRFDLNAEEKVVYNAMIQRLSDARRQTYGDLHGIHSSLQIAPEKTMTPAAIAKMIAADELKRRQKGHSVSLSDNSFKTSANGFMAGGMIGNIFKGKAMHRIGAGYGPTGEPKPNMYESAPWGVNSLSIQMAETLFANTGLRKHTQKLFYDKFAAALAKEKPYGYLKDAQGSLKNALEPDVLDAVIRSAASNMISDRAVLKQMSPIDRDILRKKFLNWESKKDTPLTESLKQIIFGLEKREMGGPVNAGQPYVVGEKGPELFVPRNAGGIVPNNKYGIGGTIGVLAASIGPMMLASKVANPLLQTIMQAISFVIPQMIMTASMQRGSGKTGGMMSKVPASMKSPMGVFSEKTGGLTKYGTVLDNLTTSGSKFKNMLGKIGMGLSRFNVGLAVGSIAVYAAVKAYQAHNEHLRIGALQYGLTAAAAEKAGLKYTDYNKKLADTVANIKALKERNQLLYESMQDAGTPIKLTIEEYKKLRKEVKSVYADQIKLINQTDGGGNTKKLAQDLKIQLMAAGMSAEDATKKIWAMFKMSNKAKDAASFTLGNSAFNKIETKQDAAARAVAGYSRSAAEGGREGAGSVNTGLTAIDTGIQDLIDKSKAANKKDKNKPILTEYEAQEKMLQRLNNLEASKAVLTRETINEMVKQNPELKKIINPMDTIVSLWGKMNLAAKGFTGDLSKLGAEAVSTLSKVADAISAATISENKKDLLKNQYEALERLTDQQKALMKAAKGQSAAQQINTREQLKGLQKQIDANNKLADARLKALDAAKQEGDIAREIAKKQAEYDSALATGNVAAAQQASLDIKGLQSDQQYNAQKKAIEDALKLKNAPLEAKIQAINDGQQKMSDKAALAADSLSKLNDKIAKQRQKIDDVNLAMTSLRLNAAALGLTIDDYVKTYDGKKAAAAVVASTNAAGAKIPTTSGSTGHPSSGVSSDVAAQALAILNTASDAVAKGLAAKGMEIKTMTGDIYINNKKMDVTPAKIPTSPPGVVIGNTMSTYKKEDMSLKEASKKAVTDKQSKQFIGAAGDQYYLFKYGQIVYAVDKTTGAVKLFDEATKTTGKVVKFAPGGKVSGPGTPTSDSIPAYLSNGEYVIKEKAVRQYGVPFFDELNAQKFHTGGVAGHKHLSAGHMASNYKAPDTSFIQKAWDKFLFPLALSADRLQAAFTGTTPFASTNQKQYAAWDKKAREQGIKSITKEVLGQTAMDSTLLLSPSSGVVRSGIEAYGVSKGIPALGSLLPKGSFKFAGAIGSKLATNAATAAVIGAAKPFNQHLSESILPKPTISQSIVEQKIGSNALASSINAINNAMNKTTSADEASVKWLNSVYALAERIGAANGRRVPSFTGDRSLYSVSAHNKSQFTMMEHLDDETDNILNWPWYSSKKDITSGSQFNDPIIEKLTSRQKRAIAKVTNNRYNSSKSFSITNEELRNGYKQYYIDHPEGDWDSYLNKELGKVGLKSPLYQKFAGYTEDPRAFLETKKDILLSKSDDRVSFPKFVTGPVRKKPEFGEAYGNYNSHVSDSPLFAPGDYSEALRNKFEKVYKDLIKSGYIQKAEFINGKRVAQKSKAPLPDEHYSARDTLHQSTSPRGKSYTLNEFLQLLASSVPNAMTSSKQAGSALNYLDRPTDFVRTVNESLAKQMGLTPGEKLTFWKYDLYGTPLKNDKGAPVAAGYYSLDKGMAYSYPRQRGNITQQHLDDPNSSPGFGSGEQGQTRGGYKMELYPHEVPQVIGFGGMADELAIVVGETLAKEKSVWQGPAKASEWQYGVDADAIRGLSFLKMYKPGKWEVGGEGKFDITPEQLDEAALAINSGKFKTTVKNEDYRGKDLGPWTGESIKAKLWSIAELIQKDGKNRSLSLEAIPAYHVENSHQGLDNILQVQELYNLIRTNVQKLKPITMLDKKFNNNLSTSSMMPPLKIGNNASYSPTLKIPKFETGVNSVPVDMLAMLHKNEAVVPANMNPFNPNANNATMGATYNITNNINGYDGDLNQLSNMVTQKTITAITAIDKINTKMVGNPMNVSINR